MKSNPLKRLFTEDIDKRSLFYKIAYQLHKQRSGIVANVFNDRTKAKPRVGLSYMLLPFQIADDDPRFFNHSNLWQNRCIAEIFRDLGYIVDAIDARNQVFEPRAHYDVYFDNGWNFERLESFLPTGCLKIRYATSLHWLDRNRLEYVRLHDLLNRRGVVVPPKRLIGSFRSDLCADALIMIGNEVMRQSYRHITKPVHQVLISVPHELFDDRDKEWEVVRHNFAWIGGGGCVHKGLDLALEAFVEMPELMLHIFGSADKESEFEDLYRRELYKTANINFHGFVDITDTPFSKICARCVALINPSAGEGTGNSNLVAMAKGLIPIISNRCAVDVDGSGIVLPDCRIETIRKTVRKISNLPDDELARRSHRARDIVRVRHTRDQFKQAMSEALRATVALR